MWNPSLNSCARVEIGGPETENEYEAENLTLMLGQSLDSCTANEIEVEGVTYVRRPMFS